MEYVGFLRFSSYSRLKLFQGGNIWWSYEINWIQISWPKMQLHTTGVCPTVLLVCLVSPPLCRWKKKKKKKKTRPQHFYWRWIQSLPDTWLTHKSFSNKIQKWQNIMRKRKQHGRKRKTEKKYILKKKKSITSVAVGNALQNAVGKMLQIIFFFARFCIRYFLPPTL